MEISLKKELDNMEKQGITDECIGYTKCLKK